MSVIGIHAFMALVYSLLAGIAIAAGDGWHALFYAACSVAWLTATLLHARARFRSKRAERRIYSPEHEVRMREQELRILRALGRAGER